MSSTALIAYRNVDDIDDPGVLLEQTAETTEPDETTIVRVNVR